MSSGGCAVCDYKKNAKGWTGLAGSCFIAETCFKAGARHPGGCSSCDPTKSTSKWTPDATACVIGGACVKDGASDGGCKVCDIKRSKTG